MLSHCTVERRPRAPTDEGIKRDQIRRLSCARSESRRAYV
jgi:hypothetical protein